MHQKNEAFFPKVIPVTVGTTVVFPNEDPFYHNVFSVQKGGDFDLGRYAVGKSAMQKFSTPGEVVVRCEIHAGMKAYILVLDTRYFTTPDAEGDFSIPAIPAGTYTVTLWHHAAGEQSRAVQIPENGEVKVKFTF